MQYTSTISQSLFISKSLFYRILKVTYCFVNCENFILLFNSYTVVHKTEVIKNTLNPTWKPFSVTARTLCNGDHERTIKIECYDWDSDGT